MEKTRKLIVLLLALAICIAMFAGWTGKRDEEKSSSAEQKGETITLTDNVGRVVELPYPVQTAVVANRYNSELIRACGAIDRVISVDMNTAQDRVYWAMFDPENVIGKSQRDLDYEKIIELNPQVVILPDNGVYEEAEKQLEPFGIKVFVISGYDTDDFVNQCANIGKMFDVEERANEFSTYFTDLIAYIDTELEGVEKRTYYSEGNGDYSAVLPGNTFYTMFELAHGENIFADGTVSATGGEIDPEEVISRNPDAIFKVITPAQALTGTGLFAPPKKEQFVEVYEGLKSRAAWDDVTAIEDDEIYFMTQFSHGGATKLVGTMFVAKSLYPELLPDLDPKEVFRAWMEDWQGIDNVEGHFYSASDLK